MQLARWVPRPHWRAAGLPRRASAGEPAEYRLVGWVFLRCLAAIDLAAFWSLAVQIEGLAGSQGIYPITEQLARMADRYGAWRFLAYPSVFWIDASDQALAAVAYAGCAFSVVLLATGWMCRRLERPALILLYGLYLALYHAGQHFTNFQWDYLLLEAGFLAIFLPGGPRLTVWLFRWLLFRLRFLSGISKVLSGDPTWSGLTALHFYFETQPLPHVGAWYAHQLPDWLLRLGTAGTLVVEILVPLMIFLPRPWRLAAAWLTILWQVLILLTSNHNFFNLLTIALCLFLFDDRALARVLPRRIRERASESQILPERPRRAVTVSAAIAAAIVVPASLMAAVAMVPRVEVPKWALTATDSTRRYRIANPYHVFPTIETARIELQIEGSLDGQDWRPYEFRYWPVDIAHRPPFVVPHQPRIDWMMWFVPVSPLFLDWFERFLHRLLEGSPPVVALLAKAPFGETPPNVIRVEGYVYRFTTPEERAKTGHWWQRDDLGPFAPLPSVRRAP